jgi:mannose-6-phosphate isomerase
MRKVDKPWGYEEIWAETNKYVGKILTIFPNQRLSLQYHEKKEETIYVLEGRLIVWHSEDPDDITHIEKGGTYHVKPNTVHRFGSFIDICKLLEVSTPELDDVVRLADDYDR